MCGHTRATHNHTAAMCVEFTVALRQKWNRVLSRFMCAHMQACTLHLQVSFLVVVVVAYRAIIVLFDTDWENIIDKSKNIEQLQSEQLLFLKSTNFIHFCFIVKKSASLGRIYKNNIWIKTFCGSQIVSVLHSMAKVDRIHRKSRCAVHRWRRFVQYASHRYVRR